MFLDTKPIADVTNVNPLGPLGSLGPVVPQNLTELPTTPIQQLKNPITACTKVDTAAEKADGACYPHRPENRGRSHLEVAGWLASAFCKPFSTSLKPKNGLNTFGKTLGKPIGKPWFTNGNTRKCSGTHSHPTKKWFAGPLCKPYLR